MLVCLAHQECLHQPSTATVSRQHAHRHSPCPKRQQHLQQTLTGHRDVCPYPQLLCQVYKGSHSDQFSASHPRMTHECHFGTAHLTQQHPRQREGHITAQVLRIKQHESCHTWHSWRTQCCAADGAGTLAAHAVGAPARDVCFSTAARGVCCTHAAAFLLASLLLPFLPCMLLGTRPGLSPRLKLGLFRDLQQQRSGAADSRHLLQRLD
jgi:hypothetical protein